MASKIRFLRRKGMVGEFVSVYLHSVRRAVYIARLVMVVVVVTDLKQTRAVLP